MRFVIFGIFLTLWMGMWVWTYTCHIKAACCAVDARQSESQEMPVPSEIPVRENNALIAFYGFREKAKIESNMIWTAPGVGLVPHSIARSTIFRSTALDKFLIFKSTQPL